MIVDKKIIAAATTATEEILKNSRIYAALGPKRIDENSVGLGVYIQGRIDEGGEIRVPEKQSEIDQLMREVREILSGPQILEALKNVPKDIKFLGMPRADLS